jgi:hypothetical protein
MVEVHGVPACAMLWIKDTKGFRAHSGAWQFETKRPLLPGVVHIYTVYMQIVDKCGRTATDFRVIRMIPGRIVDVSF